MSSTKTRTSGTTGHAAAQALKIQLLEDLVATLEVAEHNRGTEEWEQIERLRAQLAAVANGKPFPRPFTSRRYRKNRERVDACAACGKIVRQSKDQDRFFVEVTDGGARYVLANEAPATSASTGYMGSFRCCPSCAKKLRDAGAKVGAVGGQR